MYVFLELPPKKSTGRKVYGAAKGPLVTQHCASQEKKMRVAAFAFGMLIFNMTVLSRTLTVSPFK